MNRRREVALSLLALAALALALHGRSLRGEALLGADLLRRVAPWRETGAPAWNLLALDPVRLLYPKGVHFQASGGANWDPRVVLGHPTGASSLGYSIHDAYPPLGLTWRLFPAWLAPGVFSLLSLFLAGAGALAWLRWRGHGPRAALAGAIAWELSPLATAWLEFPTFQAAAAPWAVLVAWASEALAREPRLRSALLLGGALGGAGLANLVVGVQLHVAALVLLLAAGRGRRRRALAWAALAVALGGVLCAASALPGLLALQGGHRAPPAGFAQHLDATLRLELRHLSLLVAPDLLGSPLRGFNWVGAPGQSYANYQEARLYLGLPALFLALAGLGRRTRGAALLALVALLLAFPTPLARLAALTPLGSTSPGRWLCLWHLAAPPLVAAGVGALASRDLRARRVAWGLGGATLALALLAGWAPFARVALLPSRGVDPAAAARATEAQAPALRPWGPPVRVADPWGREAWLLSPTLGPLLLLGGTLGAAALARRPGRRRLGLALLAGLLAHDLLREGVVYNPSAPPGALFPDTPGLERLRALQGQGRVLPAGGIPENVLVGAGLRTVGGYTSLRPARTEALFQRLKPRLDPGDAIDRQVLAPRSLPPAWRDALAVTAVACAPGRAPARPEGLVPAWSGPDLLVWENPGALPRARLHAPDAVWARSDLSAACEALDAPGFDPRRHVVIEAPGPVSDGAPGAAAPLPVEVLADEAERVELRVAAPQGGVLVLADAWSPGWSVALEGAPAAPLPADVALRAVRLEPGFQGRVTWRHRLPGLRAGALLSGLGLALLLLGLYRTRPGPSR